MSLMHDPYDGYLVICPDGVQRHGGAFRTPGKAEAWADHGHPCLSPSHQHTITTMTDYWEDQ